MSNFRVPNLGEEEKTVVETATTMQKPKTQAGRRTPELALAPKDSAHTTDVEQAALWSVDSESTCPACKAAMVRATAAQVPVYVCTADRIVLPVRQHEFSAK